MNTITVMIIDDEEAMRALIKTFLVIEGYSVIEASNGMEALEMINHEAPDLIVADVTMPYMDGFSFAAELKKNHHIPLIFLSAKGEEWDKIQGLKLGGDDYMLKPFHQGELLPRIESVLRRVRQSSVLSNRLTVGPLVS
ncbi:response regulator transcription factor [Bacillus sp. V2I10]|uniref:response regulator transcription factor n=1 Tax=Bacillus sp. V2I10 TaxID=3042276 RepID=UPI00277DE74B|nr:response regulator [Bacillus sp. V2I10]MDQ0861489.1 DNA-binding response OmpR family regulator [Bacillus sp. V2I10]